MTMIDTVIFDIGNVLTEWHWRDSFAQMFGEELVEPLADATVRSAGWYELDRGALSEEEIVDLLTQNAPKYGCEIARIVHFSEFGYNRAKPRFDFLQYADGGVISYEVKEVKPDRIIYDTLCKKYGIEPSCAVFLDDRPENAEAAIAYGMHAITVETKAQTDAALHALGVHW